MQPEWGNTSGDGWAEMGDRLVPVHVLKGSKGLIISGGWAVLDVSAWVIDHLKISREIFERPPGLR